jgi:hypothetical protein
MSFCDYSKMNFKAMTGKNQMRHMDATKAKLINKRVAARSTSPKKPATHYRLVLDIVLTAPPIPKAPTPVTPPPTRATTPEPGPEPVRTSTRTITVYGRECNVELPSEMDIYEGLRLHYPLLYSMVLDEEKEITYATQIDEYERDYKEYQMSYIDYLEWMYD